MFPYFIIFGIFSLLGVFYAYTKNKIIRWICIYLFFLIFIFFYSFSCNIAFDWRNYKIFYEKLNSLSFIDIFNKDKTDSHFEPLFLILSYIINRLGFDYQGLVVITSFGTLLLYYDVFKKMFQNFALVVLTLFIILYGNRLFVSTLRQNIAVVFIFYMYFFYTKRDKKWIYYFLTAFFFHYTTIVILAVVALDKFKPSKSFYIILSTVFTLLAFFHFDILSVLGIYLSKINTSFSLMYKIVYYTSEALSEEAKFNFYDIFYVLIFILLVIMSKRLSIFHALGFTFIFFNLLFPMTNIIIFRLRYYLSIGFIYLLIKDFKFKENINLIKLPAMYCFCLLFYAKIYILEPEGRDFVNPYDNYIISKIEYPYEDPYKMNDMRWAGK